MADFINTADVIGDDELCDQIIQKTVTEYKDDAVTNIGAFAFYGCAALAEIDLPNAVKLEQQSFRGCTNLVSVNLPKVTTIPAHAFYDCKALEYYYNVEKLTDIGSEAFGGAKFTSLCLPLMSKLGGGGLRGLGSLKIVDLPICTQIGSFAFYTDTSLTAVILRSPTLCALDDQNAFMGGYITNYTPIHNGTGYIYVPHGLLGKYRSATNWSTYANQFRIILDDEDALQGMINGTLVNYENSSTTSILSRSFYNYQKLETIKFPNVTELWTNAFYGCTSLKEITADTFPKVTSYSGYLGVGTGIFEGCTGLKSVVWPSLEVENNVDLFKNCTSLTYVDMPNLATLGQYGGGMFSGCTSLADVNLPKLTRVQGSFFYECKSLKHLILPSAASIFGNTFQGSGLEVLDLPVCTSISGNYTIGYIPEFKALVLRSPTVCSLDSTTTFNNNTNMLNGTAYIYVPKTLINSYKSATNWSTYANQFRAIEDYKAESISLSTSEMVFTTSDSQTLTATVTPSNIELVWSYTGNAIKLKDGVVTPLYDGTATITVTDTLGICSATCTVTVSGVREPPAETLYSLPEQTTLNGTSDYIDTGIKLFDTPKSFTIVCTAEFNKLGSNKCLFHCMNEAAPYPGVSMDGNSGARVCYTGTTSLTASISPAYSIKTIVLRYVDGVLDAIKYFDTGGKLNNVNVGAGAKYTTVAQNLILGAYQTTNGTKGRYYAGTIYNFDVYAHAMTDDEIAALI